MTWIEGQINNETIFPPDVRTLAHPPSACVVAPSPRRCAERSRDGAGLWADTPFPKDFKAVCRNIFKRLVRVFAHVYLHHFDVIVGTRPPPHPPALTLSFARGRGRLTRATENRGRAELGAEAHINACFKHFYFFTKEFALVDDQEYEPLVRMAAPSATGVAQRSWAHAGCAGWPGESDQGDRGG
jgi:hypothetical protein